MKIIQLRRSLITINHLPEKNGEQREQGKKVVFMQSSVLVAFVAIEASFRFFRIDETFLYFFALSDEKRCL